LNSLPFEIAIGNYKSKYLFKKEQS